jgi:hypothetical protein
VGKGHISPQDGDHGLIVGLISTFKIYSIDTIKTQRDAWLL